MYLPEMTMTLHSGLQLSYMLPLLFDMKYFYGEHQYRRSNQSLWIFFILLIHSHCIGVNCTIMNVIFVLFRLYDQFASTWEMSKFNFCGPRFSHSLTESKYIVLISAEVSQNCLGSLYNPI